ncbi:portal protein [Mycobacterium phage Guanica15]|uniref:Portal protein n=1 Tax=Mycobacterium phage Yunkel11 TaxID=2599886 RepID=A0A5J6TF76_9CAUD|nr:portal protein [Mycobacterium phage Yunkel11]QFG08397.1 portal protein [Mycobacterium phage Yunkel11]QFG09201.1 portal protein [Mycobacterium phage Efra2]QFG11621.1 portal protein [Mycobacterium phage Guanica15]
MIPQPYDDVQDDEGETVWPDDALDREAIGKIVADMYALHLQERTLLDRIYEYTKGLRGRPTVPEGASDEVKELASLSIKNVLRMIRNSFAQSLSVVGYRTITAQENHPAWRIWQANRMDARQAEVHRPAVQYGAAYVVVTPGEDGTPEIRCRSPRQLLAVYDDPVLDAWPQYALETWVTNKNAKRHRRGVLYDERYMYELDLGELSVTSTGEAEVATKPITLREVDDIIPHGATDDGKPVCPAVRFVNDRDADDMIVGEIEPLIGIQKAINCVNFDRLIVCRFGANPQRVISGWTGSKSEVLKASALRVWTFDDPEVKAQAFPPASVEPYNAVLAEMMEHVVMEAQVSPSQVKVVNVSAEALAAAEHREQLKLANKRESFGEAWEQVLRLCVEMDASSDTTPDRGAEVVWRDTEARSFGAVVDGVVKLAQAGVPIEYLLPMVPGMTQQQIQAIKQAIRGGNAKTLVDALMALPQAQLPDAPPVDQVVDDADDDLDEDDGENGGGVDDGDTRVSGRSQ